MRLQSTITNRAGQVLKVIYNEGDPLQDLEGKILQGVHAFCFCDGRLVLIKHAKSGWLPPGGGIEPGETYEEALVREVREETSMEVTYQELIGYQDIYEPGRTIRQTRSFCVVKPLEKFAKDPEGEIEEIKLIDPSEYKNYFDWGEIGERIMQRALELKSNLK